jgi:hypothetical protein
MFSGVRHKIPAAAMAALQARAVQITKATSLAAEKIVNAVAMHAWPLTANVARLHQQAISTL